MKTVYLLLALACCHALGVPRHTISSEKARNSLPVGNAAWVYDIKGGNPAMWKEYLDEFNLNNNDHPISVVYSYGGDMEYYPGTSDPYQTYFSSPSQQAARVYKGSVGVDHVIAVVDGRMGGGEDWSPDLSKLSIPEVKQWADITAELYCSFDMIDGIQVDLEPFAPPYASHLLVYIQRLGESLRTKGNNCVSPSHPNGRSISAFMHAYVVSTEVMEALGPNGYAIVSGYDLGNGSHGVAHSPQQFGERLDVALSQVLSVVKGTNYTFVLGIPAAASTNEFEVYIKEDGTEVKGYPQYDAEKPSYVVTALNVIKKKGLKNSPNYLGTALWGFSSAMSYPPHSFNLFYPTTPFVVDGEDIYLKNNL